ncbi:MAG: PSD1 and planctomycete cytochrome C domain-containing protein, partial [Planctomycetota bacterium]
CLDCHGAEEELQGGLDLRLVRFMAAGGESGPALVPGDPGASLLLARVRAGEMPPGSAKMTPAEVATLERWVASGARTARPEPETLPPGLGITPEERAWWAFQPLARPAAPQVRQPDLVTTPIDAFVLARLQRDGLSFGPPADRAALIRRATFDLTGLPPSAEEVEAFVADPDPGAYEKLLDRLLASPHYGERQARHWLDAAGYADSSGANQDDTKRPYAWKYRDWVIRAFAADMPLDRFLVEQLAGDELVPPPHANLDAAALDRLTATGFLRMAADGTAGASDPDAARHAVVADTLTIVSTALLGLSVNCAQCHDHRYDPIPQADYYALRAILAPALDPAAWKTPPERLVSLFTDADRARCAEIEAEAVAAQKTVDDTQAEAIAKALEKELEKHPEELRERLRTAAKTPAGTRTPEQVQILKERPSVDITPGVLYQYDQPAADELKKLAEGVAAIRAKKPVEDFLHVLTEPPGHLPVTRVLHRGDHRQLKGEVGPADLQVTGPEGETAIAADDTALPTSGRRLAWARRLTSGRHPLLGRVLANRLWMQHFGRGIVATPADFGRLGEKPTHPELLDWLAVELADSGWSVKQFHRLVMRSTAYRQAATRRAELDAVDADNRLLGRMAVRRLDAEGVRDRMLAASGALDPTPFGAPVPVSADDTGEFVADPAKPRRSIYVEQRRSMPVAFLSAFDAPVMETNCLRRPSSTVAGQALVLMNGPFALDQARVLAEKALAAAPVPAEADAFGPGSVAGLLEPAVEQAWRRALARSPDAAERREALAFLADQLAILRPADPVPGREPAAPAAARAEALANLCQQLLSCNEFLYVD